MWERNQFVSLSILLLRFYTLYLAMHMILCHLSLKWCGSKYNFIFIIFNLNYVFFNIKEDTIVREVLIIVDIVTKPNAYVPLLCWSLLCIWIEGWLKLLYDIKQKIDSHLASSSFYRSSLNLSLLSQHIY